MSEITASTGTSNSSIEEEKPDDNKEAAVVQGEHAVQSGGSSSNSTNSTGNTGSGGQGGNRDSVVGDDDDDNNGSKEEGNSSADRAEEVTGDGDKLWMYLDGVNPTQHGPFPQSVMLKLLRTGSAHKDMMAWSEGMAEWSSIGQVCLSFTLVTVRCSALWFVVFASQGQKHKWRSLSMTEYNTLC